jgi:hypothetical protein
VRCCAIAAKAVARTLPAAAHEHAPGVHFIESKRIA